MDKKTNGQSEQRIPVYLQLVHDIIKNIEKGVYKPGEKLPSIRQMSDSRGISIMTVLKSYQELLSRGYILSRPQSGYFVIEQQRIEELEKHIMLPEPRHVEMPDMTRIVLLDSSDESLVPLGSGVPAPSLLPARQLSRITASILQSSEVPLHITGNAEGANELRLQLAKHMFLSDTPVQMEDIVVTNGCNEALFIAFSVICNSGDLVAVESPCYFGVLQIMQELGLRAIEIPEDKESGIGLEALRTALEQNSIKAIFVNSNCNNPQGHSIPEEKKKKLAELIDEFNVPLIEDNSTGDLYFGKNRPGTIKAYDKKGLVVYCSSFSKVLAPAYRIGWIVPGKFKKQVIQFKHALNLSCSPLLQTAIAKYISQSAFERHMKKSRQAYYEKISRMSECICRYFPDGTNVSHPAGGMFLWVALPQKIDTMKLYKAARDKKISIAPGRMFSINDSYTNYIRMNAAFYDTDLQPVFQSISSIIRTML